MALERFLGCINPKYLTVLQLVQVPRHVIVDHSSHMSSIYSARSRIMMVSAILTWIIRLLKSSSHRRLLVGFLRFPSIIISSIHLQHTWNHSIRKLRLLPSSLSRANSDSGPGRQPRSSKPTWFMAAAVKIFNRTRTLNDNITNIQVIRSVTICHDESLMISTTVLVLPIQTLKYKYDRILWCQWSYDSNLSRARH